MRNLSSIFLAGTIFLAACNSSSTKDQRTDSLDQAEAATEGEAGAACYQKVVGKDTFLLQLIVKENKANGVLEYNFHEKDRSSGLIDGSINENILRATYRFKSEGQTSDRPVVFKVMGEQVYEALAETFDTSGVPVFNNDNSLLKFEPQPYNKVACK